MYRMFCFCAVDCECVCGVNECILPPFLVCSCFRQVCSVRGLVRHHSITMCLCAFCLKKTVPEMTYTVSGRTLNPTHSVTHC